MTEIHNLFPDQRFSNQSTIRLSAGTQASYGTRTINLSRKPDATGDDIFAERSVADCSPGTYVFASYLDQLDEGATTSRAAVFVYSGSITAASKPASSTGWKTIQITIPSRGTITCRWYAPADGKHAIWAQPMLVSLVDWQELQKLNMVGFDYTERRLIL